MARVAVAYVEIRPDLSLFAEKLQAELAAIQDSLTIKIDADTTGFSEKLQAQLERVNKTEKVLIEPNTTGFIRKMREKLDAYQQVVYRVTIEPDMVGFFAKLKAGVTALGITNISVPVVPSHIGSFFAEIRARARVIRPIAIPVVPDIAEFRTILREALTRALEQEGVRAARRAGPRVGEEMGRSFAGNFLRTIARSLGRYNFVAFIAGGMLRALASVVDVVSRMGGRVLTNIGQLAADALGKVTESTFELGRSIGVFTTRAAQQTSTALAGVTASAVETAAGTTALAASTSAATGGTATLAGAMFLLAAGLAAVSAAGGAVQVILGAILAVAIPLAGAISAVVAALGQLAAVGVGAIGLIPTALGASLAAFGPLAFVAEKFSKLMEDTAGHTGELFVVVEKLRNAIFAVMSTGFVQAVTNFADNTLPKLYGGIIAVSSAWNRFLLGLVDLASRTDVIDNLNVLLGMGARLVDFFSRNLAVLAPALLTMATVGAGAFEKMLTAVSGLVDMFASWVTQMAASGQMATFFDTVATLLVQILGLVTILAPLMLNWITAILPEAGRFLVVLGLILEYWRGLSGSAAGQQVIRDFFESMNRILLQIAPMLTLVVDQFMRFGPTLATLVEGAGPAFEALTATLFDLLRNLAPGILDFLAMFAANLRDPSVQFAMKELADSINALMRSLGSKANLMSFIVALTLLADGLNFVVASAETMLVGTTHVVNGIIHVINFLIEVINSFIDALNYVFRGIGVNMERITPLVVFNANKISGALGEVGGVGTAAFNAANSSLTAFANSPAWQAILTNASLVSRAVSGLMSGARIGEMRATFAMLTSGGLGGAFGGALSSPVATKAASSAGSKAGKATAAGFITSLNAALSELKAADLLKQSAKWTAVGLNIAKYIAKGITSGTANINKVAAYIMKKFPAQIRAIQRQIEKYRAAATPFIKELGRRMNLDQLNALLDQIKDFKASAFEALTPSRDVVGVFGFIPTPAEVRNQLQAQLDTMRQFAAGIEALQSKGLSKELAQAWLMAGAESGGNLVQGLQDATPAQIAEINKLYAQIGTDATKIADSQAAQFYGIGQAQVEGYIKGIASMQTAAIKEIQKIIDAALAAAKKRLGIKSPSTVFDQLGVNTIAGYIQGVESKTTATVAAIEDLYASVTAIPPATLATPSITPGYASASAVTTTTPPPPPVNVRVYLGDREITDILRVQVDDYDTARARALLNGRRGG